MGYREERDKRNDQKDHRLIAKIREAGFNVEDNDFWRTKDGEVKFEDTVVALIRRNTGSSWYATHEGWRVQCPQFEPRGRYNERCRREEPKNPRYWGGRNFKSMTSIIDKLVEAKESIPNEAQVKEGEALAAWRSAYSKVENAKRELASNFSYYKEDFIRYVLDLLPDVDDLAVGEMRSALVDALKDLDNLDNKIAAMKAREEELSEARAAAEGEEE